MKKLLIVISIILLLVLSYFTMFRGIEIGKLKIPSINQIKAASNNLDNNLNSSIELTNKTYPESLEKLKTSIKSLTQAKDKYSAKTNYATEEINLGAVQYETYEIELLWLKIGSYSTKRGVKPTIDIVSTEVEDIYNLEFTLIGPYVGITDVLYDIENDEELKFSIQNFELTPVTKTETNSKTGEVTTSVDDSNLQAKFLVSEVSINIEDLGRAETNV